MRKILLALLVLGVLSAPARAQNWYRLESAEGAFTATLPARPEYQAVPIGGGALTLHRWLFETRGRDAAYLVSYIDYDRGHVARNGLHPLLDAMVEGFGRSVGTLLSVRSITYAGQPVREATARTRDGFIVRQRHMLVGDRGYIWNYTGLPGTEYGPAAERVLDSLVIHR